MTAANEKKSGWERWVDTEGKKAHKFLKEHGWLGPHGKYKQSSSEERVAMVKSMLEAGCIDLGYSVLEYHR